VGVGVGGGGQGGLSPGVLQGRRHPRPHQGAACCSCAARECSERKRAPPSRQARQLACRRAHAPPRTLQQPCRLALRGRRALQVVLEQVLNLLQLLLLLLRLLVLLDLLPDVGVVVLHVGHAARKGRHAEREKGMVSGGGGHGRIGARNHGKG
jgi:hypothetical protein